MAAKIEGRGEPTHDRGVWTVFPIQRAHTVPTGAEVPYHVETRRFYISFEAFAGQALKGAEYMTVAKEPGKRASEALTIANASCRASRWRV